MMARQLVVKLASGVGLLVLLVGCATDVAPPRAQGEPETKMAFDPSTLPITDADRRDAEVKQRQNARILVVAPEYDTEEYRLSSRLVCDELVNRLAPLPWCTPAAKEEVLSSQEILAPNPILLDEPGLVTKACAAGVHAVILVEVKEIQIGSQRTTTERSDSRASTNSYSRDMQIAFRVKALDTSNKLTAFDRKILGTANAQGQTLETSEQSISAASRNCAEKVSAAVVAAFQPKPTVVEVRGNGKYVKVNAGSSQGIAKGMPLKILKFLAIKGPSGEVVSIEARPVTSLLVIHVEEDSCWCDCSLAQGAVLKGYLAVPPGNG